MELVLTHNNMDFDSLASQFGVTKLNPAAQMILGFPLTGNVRDFLALHRSSLPIAQIKYLDLANVSKVYIVDCQHYERLDSTAKSLIDRGVPFTIFDHHDRDPDGLAAKAQPDSKIEHVGSATTLVVDQIIKRNIAVTPFDATLLAIGIYEDTGCLTFRGTKPIDAECLAFLLRCGADLNVVNEFIHTKLNDEQTELFTDLLHAVRVIEIHGAKVLLTTAQRDKYIDGLATLTRKLMEVESTDAAFSIAHMRDRVHVVARSDSPAVDTRPVVRAFGGDGHHGASAAVIKEGDLEHVYKKVEQILRQNVAKQKTAAEVMTTPVRTILPDISMDEAFRIMIRHGLDGILVAQNDEVIGVVSRRDVDQATHHKLGHARVSGFMSKPVISIKPETPLNEIQHLMIEEDIGRLPVIDKEGKLVGLVSRHDILRLLYGDNSTRLGGFAISGSQWHWQRRTANLSTEFRSVHPAIVHLSEEIGKRAQSLNMVAYAVGGFVRDLILNRPNFDLDYVIEGSAIALAESLEASNPNNISVVAKHERFQTSTLHYKFSLNGQEQFERSVDLSTARTEYYEYPAALPTVEPSRLEQDLMRRDFTINAMAICINPERFGELVDKFGGLDDLQNKLIRVLHTFSFIEDPTRIMRAVRFAARLNFTLEESTAEQAKHAIATGLFDDLGGTRIRDELHAILDSPNRLSALLLLSSLGAKLRYLDAELEFTRAHARAIRRAERLMEHYPIEPEWIVYLGLLVSTLRSERITGVLDRLHLQNEQKEIITEALSVRDQLPDVFDKMGKVDHGLKNSDVYHLLKNKSEASLAIVASLASPGSPLRRFIKLHLETLRYIKSEMTGADLLARGFKTGPLIGEALSALLDARLDGLIHNRAEEEKFLAKNYPEQFRE